MEELLAIKLRPKKLSDIIGQKHLVGKDKVISNLVKNKKIFSMILYGKPGIGKTSLANAIVGELNTKYRMLNAATNNKKDFDTVIEESKLYHGLILIVDEIHRMNKDKQDILLPVIESGEIILIGITSSNPYHSINPAIRSRCQLYELTPLDKSDMLDATKRVISSNLLPDLTIDSDAIDYLISLSKSDLRYLYNLIEVAYYGTADHHISENIITNITNKPNIYHDKNQDGYYDLLSAFQKSIRGSDVHASLYYLARLIQGGELDAICRRLSVIVYEDIGLANPTLGPIVTSAIQSALLLGLPEARIPLSSVVIQLALSPKSNSAEAAIDNAINLINTKDTGNVPKHLKTTSPNYKYPHNYKYSYVSQQYLPDNIKDVKIYHPRDNENERKLKEIMNKLEK
ncbi:MAG: replication-associated recombination protein A [Bacilli bacterium]|nr:replication-associated recombination protein A [bacterium]MDY3934378.1 replication-associated recombination protein A [Bacilli bacterium]